MTPIVLSVLGLASGAEEATKIAAQADLHVAARMFAQRWSYEKVAERTVIGGAANALKLAAERMPQDIAKNITKKKLAQILPLVGAAVGAGFNYWFISNTSRTAYMLFREMYLARKYPDLWDTISAQ
jgi:translation elongation factor EF-Ts